MWQDADKRMKLAQSFHEGDLDRKIGNTAKKIEAGQYIYLKQPPITTFAEKDMATES